MSALVARRLLHGYNPRNLKIHYGTRSQRQRRMLDFKLLKPGARRSVQFVDMRIQEVDADATDRPDFTEVRHRAYLEAFLGQGALKYGFADLTPTREAMLQTLRGYTGP